MKKFLRRSFLTITFYLYGAFVAWDMEPERWGLPLRLFIGSLIFFGATAFNYLAARFKK